MVCNGISVKVYVNLKEMINESTRCAIWAILGFPLFLFFSSTILNPESSASLCISICHVSSATCFGSSRLSLVNRFNSMNCG